MHNSDIFPLLIDEKQLFVQLYDALCFQNSRISGSHVGIDSQSATHPQVIPIHIVVWLDYFLLTSPVGVNLLPENSVLYTVIHIINPVIEVDQVPVSSRHILTLE